MNSIELSGLTKKYDDFCLDNISLNLPTGTIMGLVGENGAGKTTLIKLIMNAVTADKGDCSVLGIKNTDPAFSKIKNDIGVVLDEAYFPEVLTITHINAIMKKTYKNWQEKLFMDYIKRFSLPVKKQVKDFSRGMKMKLACAVALSHKAKLLILDEATSGLDPMVRDEMLDIFNEFTRDENNSILLSSHIVSDLEKICDYIAFIHQGKLIFCEEKDRLLEDYSIIKLSEKDFEKIPENAVVGSLKSKYGVEALVKKSEISKSCPLEHTTLEDIILFMAKGGK